MSSVISRPARLLVAVTASGFLLAGCGAGPVHAGAAAIVGDTRLPVTDVQTWFDDVMRKEQGLQPQLKHQGQMDDLGRQLASYRVRQELAEQAARTEHLTATDQQVDDLINQMGGPQAATAGKIYTPQNLRESARTEVLTTQLARKYINRLAVTFDFTQASTRREAEAKARRMAQGPEQAAAVIEDDRKAGLPATVGEHLRAADDGQLAATTPLFAAEAGTVLAFKPDEQSGQWLVVRIKERKDDLLSTNPVPNDEKVLRGLGQQLLGLTADRVGVQLSPRYGVWDPIAVGSAPNAGETLGFRLAPQSKS